LPIVPSATLSPSWGIVTLATVSFLRVAGRIGPAFVFVGNSVAHRAGGCRDQMNVTTAVWSGRHDPPVPKTTASPAVETTWPQVLALRLDRQGDLERAAAGRGLVDVVGRMVGLHAQVMSSAELQAAARIDGLRSSDVRDAIWERRSLVKTWAFRQTLHLLTADDLAEFVVAARSLERWHTPAWLKYFKMTEQGVDEVLEAIGDVLGDKPLTRAQVVDAVVERVRRPHLREDMLTGWGTFLGPAAQRGRLVFGPSEGRNVAFVDPSAWLGRPIGPDADPAAADAALARLIVRYLAVFP
jgi:hypothetical protein